MVPLLPFPAAVFSCGYTEADLPRSNFQLSVTEAHAPHSDPDGHEPVPTGQEHKSVQASMGERGNGGPSIVSETPYAASTVEPLNTFIHPFDKRSMPLLRVIGGQAS